MTNFYGVLNDVRDAVKKEGTYTYSGVSYSCGVYEERSNLIGNITEDYVASLHYVGKNDKDAQLPHDSELIEQFTDLLLHEDLTDTTAWKSRSVDYPILSDIQLARRKFGIHQRKGAEKSGEVSFKAVENNGHKLLTRRKRTKSENIYVDEVAKSRNKERQRRYEEFTKVQPVRTYRIDIESGEIIDD